MPDLSAKKLCLLSSVSLLLLACQNDSDEGDNLGLSGSSGLPPIPGETGDGDSDEQMESANENSDSEPNSSNGNDEGSGSKDSSSSQDSSGDSAEEDGNDDSDEADNSDSSSVRFDVETPDAGDFEEEQGFSYIWIANTAESTVSKIDTRTVVEDGRYLTRGDAAGSPSRTSVNLAGDVAVANRAGGIIKIFADQEDCVDKDGSGTIDTADGKDFLPWNQDECVAWYTPMNYGSQRAVQWTRGDYDPDKDELTNVKLWVGGSLNGEHDTLEMMVLNGDTGEVEQKVTVEGAAPNGTTASSYVAAYGGAVDSKGDLWFNKWGGSAGLIGVVRLSNMSYQLFDRPKSGYGITVGPKDRVWTCMGDLGRFSPATQTWDYAAGNLGDARVRGTQAGGCMVDGENRLWIHANLSAGGNAIAGVDIDTMALKEIHAVPEYVHGISIDFDGFVWAVSYHQNNAYKVHPTTGAIETFDELVNAYTYSDMTGFALAATGTQVD